MGLAALDALNDVLVQNGKKRTEDIQQALTTLKPLYGSLMVLEDALATLLLTLDSSQKNVSIALWSAQQFLWSVDTSPRAVEYIISTLGQLEVIACLASRHERLAELAMQVKNGRLHTTLAQWENRHYRSTHIQKHLSSLMGIYEALLGLKVTEALEEVRHLLGVIEPVYHQGLNCCKLDG